MNDENLGELPVLVVTDGITYTEDERLLVDGQPVPPGRYRLQLTDGGEMPMLTVAGDDEALTVISATDLS